MTVHKEQGARIEGERLYVVYERPKGKPHLVSTKGRHNCQAITVEGNPASAHVILPLRYLTGGGISLSPPEGDVSQR